MNTTQYKKAILSLANTAFEEWKSFQTEKIFTIVLLTDPGVASAIAIDTRENSIENIDIYNKSTLETINNLKKYGRHELVKEYEHLILSSTRWEEPSGYKYPALAEIIHNEEFEGWENTDENYSELESIMLDLRNTVLVKFQIFLFESDAASAISSPKSWYDHEINISEWKKRGKGKV